METLIEQLKVILGTNFALYLKAHGYHWNIEGSNFPQYHDFLSDFYTSIFEQTDPIAEHGLCAVAVHFAENDEAGLALDQGADRGAVAGTLDHVPLPVAGDQACVHLPGPVDNLQ